MKEIVKEIWLNNQQIEELSSSLEENLAEFGVKGQDIIRIKLSVEDILLNFQEHFGVEKKAKMLLHSRMGQASLTLLVAGESFDPIMTEQQEEEFEGDLQGILFNLGLFPVYQYKKNLNVVLIPLPKKKVNAAWNLIIALITALIMGFVGNLLSQGVRDSVNAVLTTVYDILFGMIGMLAAPMVFLTMLSGVCEIGDLGKLKNFGKKVIGTMAVPFAAALLLCGVLPFLFPLTYGQGTASESALESIVDAIAGVFPSNIIAPFANGDYAQIVVLAILLGIGMLILAQEIPTVFAFVGQLNRVISLMLGYLCRLIPIIILVTVVQIIWSGEVLVIFSAWKPVVFVLLWLLIQLVWQTVSCAKKMEERPMTIGRQMISLFIMGLTTASGSACYSMMEQMATEKLQAEKKIAGFSIPIGMMLFVAGEFLEFLTIAIYFGSLSGTEVTISWFLLAVILSFIFSIAAPPIAGGSVVVMGLLFSLLNIPSAYLGVAGAVSLLLDYPCTATRVFCLPLIAAGVSHKAEQHMQ